MKIGAILVSASVLAPTFAYAGPLGGGQSPDINLVRIGLSLLLCLIVAGAAILMLRRKVAGPWLALARGEDSQAISIKETRRIGLHAELCRFACDGQEFLIVVTPHGATLLRERPVAPPLVP